MSDDKLPLELQGKPELIRKRAQVIIAQRLFFSVVGAIVIASLALLTVNAYIAMTNRAQLYSCTTPGRVCYQEGQERMAIVVQKLIEANALDEKATRRIVVITTNCSNDTTIRSIADREVRLEQIQLCVDRQLKIDKAEGVIE